jgi:hypothetical protein
VTDARAQGEALQRDRPETPFSKLLGEFLRAHDRVLCAVFVDAEGECVDYASRVDPYEAMVFGATLLEPTARMVKAYASAAAGQPVLWVLSAERLDAVVRRVSDEHMFAVWLEPGALSARLLRAMAPLAEFLRREAGLPAPDWDPEGEPLEVETREAKGWGYAPRSMWVEGRTVRDLEVLGRWTERGTLTVQEAICFRVRAEGQELTLVHEPALKRWYRR